MKKPEEIKTRVFKLLLFADNPHHMRILHRVQRLYADSYVGIWHTLHDDRGQELITGHGKKHAHVILNLDNPVYWRSICRKLGFVAAEGEPDYRFCWAMGYRLNHNSIHARTVFKLILYGRAQSLMQIA